MSDALKLAADDGDLNEVRRLIEEENVSVNQADAWGDTALHAAVAKGRLNVVTYLLEKAKADPNTPNKAGSTPLHKGAVAKFEQLQILRLLLEHKADPLKRNSSGLLPEQLAPGDLAKKILAGDNFVEDSIEVHRSKHGRIIGKGGSKMKQIQSESGAHVTIPKQNQNSDTIILKGRREAVDKAKQLILELVKGEEGSEGAADEGNRSSSKLPVPKDKHRLIIGKGGNTINEIREEMNVDIIIPPANSKDEDIIIRGEIDDIGKAIKAIERITGGAGARPSSGGYGGRRGSNGSFSSGGRNTPEGGNKGRNTPEGGNRGRGGVKS